MRLCFAGKTTIDLNLPIAQLGLEKRFNMLVERFKFSAGHDKQLLPYNEYLLLVRDVNADMDDHGCAPGELTKHISPGGSATNPITLLASFLAEGFSLCTLVGNGPRARIARDRLFDLNIDIGPKLENSDQQKIRSAASLIFIDDTGRFFAKGSKFIVGSAGKGKKLLTPDNSYEYIKSRRPDFGYLLMSNIRNYSYGVFDAQVKAYQDSGSILAIAPPTAKDITPRERKKAIDLIKNVATYTPLNDQELLRLTQRTNLPDAIEDMQGWLRHRQDKGGAGFEPLAPVSNGIDGQILVRPDSQETSPVYNKDTDMVCSVGAGDAFVAGFMLGQMLGLKGNDCVKLGSAISDYIIQQFSAQVEDKDKAAALISEVLSDCGHDDKAAGVIARLDAVSQFMQHHPQEHKVAV